MGTTGDWAQVSAGGLHTLAVRRDGTLWATGYGFGGQLGLGDTASRNSFARVGSASDWLLVQAAEGHSLGAAGDGVLQGWGSNTYGQLGLGDTTGRDVPASTGFRIDVTGPVTAALQNATARRGAFARLLYYVADELSAKATGVKIVVRRSGKTVKTFNLGTKQTGKKYAKFFRARLAKGTYRWSVFATDTAGNAQRMVGTKRLKVI